MSAPALDPTFIAGTPRCSGDVQTGEVNWTRGGGRVASFFSGQPAGDALVYSGGGRLNTVVVLNTAPTSGAQVLFYDSSVATSGGPFVLSGHKVLGTIPTPFLPSPTSGLNAAGVAGFIGQIDMPFQSGLCVSCVRASGSAGFSISFTPEANSLDRGVVLG